MQSSEGDQACIFEYPDAMSTLQLQIWNNAVFDKGDHQDMAALAMKPPSWSPPQPVFPIPSESDSKENQSPAMVSSPVPCRFPAPANPLSAIENSQSKPVQIVSKPEECPRDDERRIDDEIEVIQIEISRLMSRLEALRLQKAERDAKTGHRRVRAVAAKFMEKNRSPNGEVKKKTPRRAVSMGPSEILAGVRRGRASVGPQEILGKTPAARRVDVTPAPSAQNRRKSCIWKLQDVDEKKPGKNPSPSPKSRKTVQTSKQTGGSKNLKKDEAILSSIQPKALFKDCEKSGSSKKPSKSGRVVASRYNQTTQSNTGSAMRKRSLPESGKEVGGGVDKKRASCVGKFSDGMRDGRVKKRWEIPTSIVIHKTRHGGDAVGSPSPIMKMPDLLPRIRTGRSQFESPRDSGPAKRVSELAGKKPFFFCLVEEHGEVAAPPVSQALDFAGAVEGVDGDGGILMSL